MITVFSPKLRKIYAHVIHLDSCFEHSLWQYYEGYPISENPFIFHYKKVHFSIWVQGLEVKLWQQEKVPVLRLWSRQRRGMRFAWRYRAGGLHAT